jgi:hypothetical protein
MGGSDGYGFGGGIVTAANANTLLCLDTFTVAHVINNAATGDPNISGPYTIC